MLRLSLDKIKSIIKPEKAKDLLDKQHLDSSYSNFKFHYKEPSKAFLKDIDLIKKCKLTNTERSLIWLLFLDIIPFNNPSQWNKIISLARESYSKLRDKYITKEIETFIELKIEKDSILYDSYNTILKKEEFDLLNLIKIDVQRTYQEDEIFKLDIVKKKLVTVLYIYAKENLEAGYQQGMGDICGVFLYVLYKEFYLKSGFEKDELTSIYSLIHSNNVYLEYDLYLIFDKFMRKGIASFFLYNTSKYKENILGSKSIEEKLNLSLDDIINSNDSELKKRIYILYYLCVFTREFKLSQVVLIWDLIIMYEYVETHLLKKELLKTHLNFIEGAALSMLIHFKPFIIQKEDKNEILSGIMHFPEDISIDKICKKAIEV